MTGGQDYNMRRTARPGSGARRGGRKNVAHGDSRGEKDRYDARRKPREGRQSSFDDRKSSLATGWLSELSVRRDPTAVNL